MSNTYVQLGRTGDLITLLPILHHEAQSGYKPQLLVSKDYASLLDGVSFVEPIIFDGKAHELDKALQSQNGVIVTQVNAPKEFVAKYTYGPAGQHSARATSFVKEQWRLAGQLKNWDECWPLVFDKRDKDREQKLIDQWVPPKRRYSQKLILVSASGNSSPFPYKDLLFELLRLRFRTGYKIVDLAEVKAERFYDLLGLYEHAHCLIATDSAPLHLSWACRDLPVIALTNDRPTLWNGSPWRPNHFFYCRYSDFPQRAIEMCAAIETLAPGFKRWDQVYVWNSYNENHVCHYGPWCPIERGACGREYVDGTSRFPYFRDSLRMGLQRATSEDSLVIVTRPETAFFEDWLLHTTKEGCGYAYRMENGQYHSVVDMLCARKSIWKAILPKIPDFIFGKDIWWADGVRALLVEKGAVDLTGCCERRVNV